MMSQLSLLQMIVFTFSPMVLTIALVALVAWIRPRNDLRDGGGPEQLLSAAIRHMPPERNEWGEAMMSELMHLHARGESLRWCFALGCTRAALFPPATGSWIAYALGTVKRLGSSWIVLAVVLPTLSLPLIWLWAAASNAFMTHDNYSSGELVPSFLGAAIIACLALMFSGIPLGLVALFRSDRRRWLSLLGPAQSIGIFGYLQVVQHLANN
jgi:hypothetical protein